MGYPEEIPAGDTVALTILLDDGSDIDLGDVPVRSMGAGEENHGADGELHGGHSGEG